MIGNMQSRGATRVLVVEDEANARAAMEGFFQYHGYSVSSAASPDEALQAALRCPPDVLVCDWKLDGEAPIREEPRDGVDTAAALQRRFGSIVILITAHRIGELKTKARDADLDVTAFYRKPLSLSGLAHAIDALPARH